MSRERSLESFILKRQDYGEADQIITLFSKEEGKVRALVKSAKLPTSKLQPMLQPLFQTRVNLTGRSGALNPGLGKVIGGQIMKAYSGILESDAKLGVWYMASELVIRALPDSEPNEQLYFQLEKYANFLHETELSANQARHSIAQFQIKFLLSIGLGIRNLKNPPANFGFSLDHGGFTDQPQADSIPISLQNYELFLKMQNEAYSTDFGATEDSLDQIYKIVSRFVSYQLEREIKSQRFLANS